MAYIPLSFVRSFRVHGLPGGLEIRAVEASSQVFLDVAVSREAGLAAAVTPEGDITVTDLKTGVTRYSFSLHPLPSFSDSIFFSPAGDLLTVVVPRGNESHVDCWNMASGSHTWSCKVSGTVTDAQFSPDGHIAAAVTHGGVIHILDVHAKRETSKITQTGHGRFCVAFSPDGSRLAVGGGSTVAIWGLPGEA